MEKYVINPWIQGLFIASNTLFIILDEGVPSCYIPAHARSSSPPISTALAKSYKELTESDCIVLLNAHLYHLRRPNGFELPSSGHIDSPLGGSLPPPPDKGSFQPAEELLEQQHRTLLNYQRIYVFFFTFYQRRGPGELQYYTKSFSIEGD